MDRPECRELLDRVKDDTSSLLWLKDSESIGTSRSMGSQNLETVNMMFSFDSEIFSSKVYRMATRSNMVRGIMVDTQDMQTIRASDSDSVTDTIRPLSRIPESHLPLEGVPERLGITVTTRQSVRSFRRQSTAESIASRRSWRRSLARPFTKQKITWQSPHADIQDSTIKVLVLGVEKAGKSTLLKSLNADHQECDIEWRMEHGHDIRSRLKTFIRRVEDLVHTSLQPPIDDLFNSPMRLIRERLDGIDSSLFVTDPDFMDFPEQ